MLEIEKVAWKNFLSYGDYTTTLEVSKLGQCLITGEVEDEEEKEAYNEGLGSTIRKSNGAGKTTIISAMQWILFGRTSHSHAPGDQVVNYFIGKDCWGQITFKNGDSITRTRNYEGHNELIYVRDGDETRLNCDTLGTSKIQQGQLAKAFGLDWEIFCGSAFFSQYSKPWMEMADQARKKALERLLHVDRFAYYADVAKKKSEKLDTAVQRLNGQKSNLEREIERLEAEIGRLEEASATFGTKQQARSQQALEAAAHEDDKKAQIKLPDLDKLKAKWEVVAKIEAKIREQQTQAATYRDQADDINDEANRLDGQISRHESNAAAIEQKVKLWHDRGGKVCTSCEQPITHEHIGNKIEPLVAQATSEREKAETLRKQQEEIRARAVVAREKYKKALANVKQAEDLLASKKPTMTLQDAESIYDRYKQHEREAGRLRKLAETILTEENPHQTSIAIAKERIEQCHAEIASLDGDIARQELLNKHFYYIYKAYSDRAKIKSFVFRDHVPFINARLRHYLDVFGLDIKLELTESLGIKSNLWGYEFESGGERKRTDVAFMLATFDFHEHMFGRQCNVLVMDEVDGRLDDDGIESLINIIKNDLANRVESILIISHRENMKDTFPREIKVRRKNRFSRLEVI
jgi:DNA repair exonuclease SbcCD ATPase subunit